MKVKSSRRLVARLGLALAVAAVAAPGAQAMRMNAMSDSGGSARLGMDGLIALLASIRAAARWAPEPSTLVADLIDAVLELNGGAMLDDVAFGRLSDTSEEDILEGVARSLRRWAQSVTTGVVPSDRDFDPLREWARARASTKKSRSFHKWSSE